MTNGIDTFRAKAPWLMNKLMADFKLDLLSAAAIAGNAGHESGGFASLQEKAPVVKGSRGGYGWFQWTGPRRRDFEAYCARNGLEPSSDKANYAFLFVELTGPEKHAIAAVKAAASLRNKVVAFEQAFERAGVKHYDSRVKWAERAIDAWHAAPPAPQTGDPPLPPDVEPPPKADDVAAEATASDVLVILVGLAALAGIVALFLAAKGSM